MKLFAFVLVALVAMPLVPPAAATPQCNTFTQSRTIAGNTVTATTSSCFDSYDDVVSGYGYKYWNNVTSVAYTDASGAVAFFVDYSSWSYNYNTVYASSNEGWSHFYQAFAYDNAGSSLGVNAGESQGTYTSPTYSACNGGGGANGGIGLFTGTSAGSGASQGWGTSQTLPCTDRSVQEALP